MLNASKLIGEIVSNCIINNINCKFVSQPYIMTEGIKCSGFFDEEEIVIATKKSDWFDVLVHESCHLDQYIAKLPVYKTADRSLTIIEDWLTKKEFNKTKLLNAFKNIILLELDCERRTIEKIKRFRIPFNTKNYIQQANAYLFGYWITYKDRRWCNFPYNNEDIVSKMPTKFLTEKEYLNSDSKYLKFFREKKK